MKINWAFDRLSIQFEIERIAIYRGTCIPRSCPGWLISTHNEKKRSEHDSERVGSVK